ncbi:Tat pathway signal sequence domain protein [Streptomyces sp. NPDC020965]|uniref:Tat pathway signal sequence domain protein n=1 Tax=Streptomyces sp. NPDC020965 TaxID=3365105 RepID=UPI0037B61692
MAAIPVRHRRTTLIVTATAALAVGVTYLHATRPAMPPPTPTPWPAQTVDLSYGGPTLPGGATGDEESDGEAGTFDFTVRVTTASGPPVTVERLTQTSEALSVDTVPAPPFTVSTEKPRTVLVMIHVSDCEKAARNAGLPFLDVTLRNTRAIQEHSYILGDEYARDLARAIGAACPQDHPSGLKPPDGPARSQHADTTKRMEFPRSTLEVPLCITPGHNKSVTALARPLHQPYSPA